MLGWCGLLKSFLMEDKDMLSYVTNTMVADNLASQRARTLTHWLLGNLNEILDM